MDVVFSELYYVHFVRWLCVYDIIVTVHEKKLIMMILITFQLWLFEWFNFIMNDFLLFDVTWVAGS